MTGLLRHCLVPVATLVALAVVAVGSAFAQSPADTDLMASANRTYEHGEYAEAAQRYEALIDRGYRDAAIYFNLGSAYLQSGDLGRAVLSYLRARELSPRDPDVIANLELARDLTADRVAAERGSVLESVSYAGFRWLTRGELGVLTLLLWAISGAATGALLVWRTFRLRRVLRAVTAVLTVATLASFLLLLSMMYANPYDTTGVVTAASVEVVSGPGAQYPGEFTLYSGAQVRLNDSRHGWVEVSLPGGELRGWAPAHAVEVVGRDGGG